MNDYYIEDGAGHERMRAERGVVLTEEEYREWLLERVRALARREDELMRQRKEALDALEGMVEQHCQIKTGLFLHFFMSANEVAFEVLEDAGRLRHVGSEEYRFTTEEERGDG